MENRDEIEMVDKGAICRMRMRFPAAPELGIQAGGEDALTVVRQSYAGDCVVQVVPVHTAHPDVKTPDGAVHTSGDNIMGMHRD